LSRETKKALFYHAEPRSQNRGGEAKRGKTKRFWSPGTIWPPCDKDEFKGGYKFRFRFFLRMRTNLLHQMESVGGKLCFGLAACGLFASVISSLATLKDAITARQTSL